MKNSKYQIVIIEGMSGTGKSILAQNIWFTYNDLGIDSEWFHEEESDHPIFNDEYQSYLEKDNLSIFTSKIYNNWINFIEQSVNKVFIFEGQLLLSYLASMVWYGYSNNIILEESKELISLLKRVLHSCILLETTEPERIISNTIKNRGEKWKEWYFNEFNNSLYSKNNDVKDLKGLKQFWLDVFKLFSHFTKSFDNKIKGINITDQKWQKYYTEISAHLDIDIKNNYDIRIDNLIPEYFGLYSCESRTINVFEKQNKIFCDFGWPNLQLFPVKDSPDEFYIKGFPHQLQFNIDKEEITVTGKDIVGLKGKVFTKN